MTDAAPGTVRRQGDHHRHLVATAVALVAVAALVGPMVVVFGARNSTAEFGDTEQYGTNHLGAGTIDLELGEQTTTLTAELMSPGDTIVGWLDLENAGDLSLRYALIADNGDDILMDWLVWDLWRASGGCGVPSDAGTPLVSGVTLASGASVPLLGSALPGLDPGDRVLEPGAAERLCITATLPGDAPNALQGRSVTQDLRVAAEHHLGVDG